jgi:hypothetical protein
MLGRKRFRFLLLAWALVVAAPAFAADDEPEPAPPPRTKPKPGTKHVYTEDDLRGMRGGVSVMGSTEKPPPAAGDTKPNNTFSSLGPDDSSSGDGAPPPKPKEANCPSLTLSHALERIFAEQGFDLGHEMWNTKLFGGPDLCKALPAAEELVSRLEGDYTDPAARHARVAITLYRDLPTRQARQAAEVEGRHFLVLYNKNAWVLDTFEYRLADRGGQMMRTGIDGLNLVDEYHGGGEMLDFRADPLTLKSASPGGGAGGHQGLLDIIARPQ